MTNSNNHNAMKIYILNGRSFDTFEFCPYEIAKVFKTREEAEKEISNIQEECRARLADFLSYYHVSYEEKTTTRNGNFCHYRATLEINMADPEQREIWLALIQARSTTNRPFDGQLFKDGDVQWSEKAKDTLVTLTFTSLTLTQQEI